MNYTVVKLPFLGIKYVFNAIETLEKDIAALEIGTALKTTAMFIDERDSTETTLVIKIAKTSKDNIVISLA